MFDIRTRVFNYVAQKSGLPIVAQWFANAAGAVANGNRHFVSGLAAPRYKAGKGGYSFRAIVTVNLEQRDGSFSEVVKNLRIRYSYARRKVTAKLN